MLKGNILIAVIGTLLGCLQLSEADSCNRYTSCMEATSARSLQNVEALTLLEIDTVSLWPELLCPTLALTCEWLVLNCQNQSQPDWEHRFQNVYYIAYLRNTGCYVAANENQFRNLQDCYDQTLRSSLLTCLGTSGYDMQCLHDRYKADNNCSAATDNFFLNDLLQAFSVNPYQRE